MSVRYPFGDPDENLPGLPRRCEHPPHVAVTCQRYEADVLRILEAPDDYRRAVLSGMDYSESAEARIQALADQHSTAVAAVRAWNGYDSITGEPLFGFFTGFSKSAKTMVNEILTAFRSMSSTVTEGGVEEESRIIYSPPDYQPDNPNHQWTVALGLLAGDPVHVEVLRDGPKPWLEKLSGQRMTCAWPSVVRGHFGPGCFEYTRDLIAWSSWQFLVAVPTCAACRRALVAGPSAAVH